MAFMDKLMGVMTDDRGLFQGGKKGRVGGRVRDLFDRGDTEQPYKPSPPAREDYKSMGGGEYTPDVSPEFTTFMGDRTPENLKNWQIAMQPGGKKGFDERFQRSISEGRSPSRAESQAWDYWGSDTSQEYEYDKRFDYERGKVGDVMMQDYRKYRARGDWDRSEFSRMWGESPDPVTSSQRFSRYRGLPGKEVADMTSDALEGRPGYKSYDYTGLGMKGKPLPDVRNIVEEVGKIRPEEMARTRGESLPEDRADATARAKGLLGRAGYTGDPRIEEAGY